MRLFLKIISCVLVLSIVFSFCVLPFTAYADAADTWSTIGSIYDYYVNYDGETFFDQFSDGDFNSCSGCPDSSSGYHEWYFAETGAPISPGTGFYYCAKCGLAYSDYCATAYNDHVSQMPFDTVDNEGGLIWQPTFADLSTNSSFSSKFGYMSSGSSVSISASSYDFSSFDSFLYNNDDASTAYVTSFDDRGFGFIFSATSSSSSFRSLTVNFFPSIVFPYSGYYSSDSLACHYIFGSADKYDYYSLAETFFNAGGSRSFSFYHFSEASNYYASLTYYLPVFRFIPSASDTSTTNYYVNASRPTYNITYDLATVNNYGDYTVINNVYENQTIINEGDNIYTDIKTGNEYEIEGWEFDYTTRTYHLTLDNGDLVDVTFGDKYVTVELNGEVEYYYYATEDDSAAGCTHEYDLAESVAATCTEDGYNVYVCTLCNHSYKDQTFATGHNYQFLWTVLDTYEVDTSTLVCPGCNGTDITCTQVDKTENFTCVCNSADCAQTWTVVGSTIAGYDLYQCINCQEFYNDYTHEGVDRSDAGYWSWLQTWLQNFKTWLGEKLDALINKEVAVGGDTINNEEVNNFYDQSDTNINTDADIDYAISYTDEDGTEQETSLKGIIAKFAFIKDIWKIGQTLISVVSEDAAYAYEFDPTIGNEATTDTGEEVAAASVTEEADTLLSSGSGAPSIPLNLGAAQSVYGFNYGGEVEMLELDWYTPYKETVDKLVGGFLWLFFMWKLFMKAPGIISGASMDSSKAEDIKSGTKGKRR